MGESSMVRTLRAITFAVVVAVALALGSGTADAKGGPVKPAVKPVPAHAVDITWE